VEFGSEAVAFATLAMVLMGCSTAILIPDHLRLL
jgi:putative effector of murein hydrolase